MFTSKYFELGMQVVTAKVDFEMKNPCFTLDVACAMSKFCNKDWGELPEEDKETNDFALEYGDRLLGAYETCKGKIWIITEADRSVTTILFPDEY